MAPTGLTSPLASLKKYWKGEPEPPIPVLSTKWAVALLVLYTLIYVLPLYVWPTSRPSPTINRDSPAVIKARIGSVWFSCALCSIFTFVLCSSVENGTALHSLHLMGYVPVGFKEAGNSLFLTMILFLGPLYESGIVEGGWRDWIRLRGLKDVWTDWTVWRNIVMGPLTEEILFRSTGIPPLILAQTSLATTIFLTPLIFGLAHVHHFYEFRLTHPRVPVKFAVFRSLFQLTYTTLFGGYATFVFLRTGSLLAAVVIHAFCNCMGFPRVWGRLEGPETLMDSDDLPSSNESRKKSDDGPGAGRGKQLALAWSVVYYILLVVGAVLWWKNLYSLTESEDALVSFGKK